MTNEDTKSKLAKMFNEKFLGAVKSDKKLDEIAESGASFLREMMNRPSLTESMVTACIFRPEDVIQNDLAAKHAGLSRDSFVHNEPVFVWCNNHLARPEDVVMCEVEVPHVI